MVSFMQPVIAGSYWPMGWAYIAVGTRGSAVVGPAP